MLCYVNNNLHNPKWTQYELKEERVHLLDSNGTHHFHIISFQTRLSCMFDTHEKWKM